MLARRARTPLSWEHVFDFRRCDVALSSLITYNRPDASTCATRRRAVGAVGPSRTNLQTFSEDGNGWAVAGGTPPTVTAATTYLSQTCVKLAFASTITPGYANSRAERTSLVFPIVTGTTYSTACFVALSRALVGAEVIHVLVTGAHGIGQFDITAGNCGANVGGFSRVLVPSGTATANGTDYFVVYPGAALTADLDVYVTKLSAEAALFHTPYIPTAATAVTTTDWPRTNYIGKSSKFTDALWSRAAAGTGVAPIIVSESVPAPNGRLDATRVTFNQGSGDTLSDSSQLDYYQAASLISASYCAGIWARIPLGVTIAVRSVGASSYMALVGTGEWKRYERPETAGSAFAYISLGLRGGLGIGASTGSVTVDLWHCTLEDGSELTATIPNDTTAPLTVNTPPYGQLTTVAANVPVLEYDADGIGRGLRVESAAVQQLATTKGFKANWINNGVLTDWLDNYGTAPDGTLTTTRAYSGGTAYRTVSATAGVPMTFSVHVRNVAGTSYRLHADGPAFSSGSASLIRLFSDNSVVASSGPVGSYGFEPEEPDGMRRVWYQVTPPSSGDVNFHIHPQGTDTTEFWGANVTTGPLTSYVEGQFTRAAASALMVPSTVGLTTTSGSVLIDCEVSNTNGVLWQVGSSYSNRLMVYRDNATLRLYCVRDGSEQLGGVWIGAPFSGGNRARVALAWASGKIYASVNGGAPSTFNAGVPVSFADLALAHYLYGDGYQIDGLISELRTTSRTLGLPELVRESAL